MSFGNDWNKMIFLAALSGFFSILALNLIVPVVVVSVMGIVDRALMRLWFGPPLWEAKTVTAPGGQTA
jgi:hypothetical protein